MNQHVKKQHAKDQRSNSTLHGGSPARISTLLVLVTIMLSACDAPPLTVSDAKVRALLPGRDATAGYFQLNNNSNAPITLIGASSNLARAIEMHETVSHGDSVGMRRVKKVIVDAGQRVAFEPGGKHLMIFGVSQVADHFPITLLFDNGEQLQVSFSKLNY